jgi:hypothetical protein
VNCETCGAPIVIGEWPFCPHGFTIAGVAVISDELPQGPYLCETLGHDPVFVRSKSHLAREADARGLVNVVRHEESYYATARRRHDEELRDTGSYREY